MAPFSRRPARRTRPLPLVNHTIDSKSHASNANAAGPKLRRYGGLAALGLAAVFLLSGDNDGGLSSHQRGRQLRVLDGANVQELLARPVDLPYDPTNPFLSRGERNLKSAQDEQRSETSSSKGWSVGDVFSRSSAGDYNDDGSDASHRSLSSGSAESTSSGGGWFSWGSSSNSFGGLGDDLRSIQDALDAATVPTRRFLAKWNEGTKRYLYEWTDGVTSEAVGEDEAGEAAAQDDDSDPRPVMHTFFDAISSKGLEDELALVAAWESAWQSAGWRTRVLTSDDARRHFQYDELWPLIDAMPLIQYDKRVPSYCCILYSCTLVLSLTLIRFANLCIYDCAPFLFPRQAVLPPMARHGRRRRRMDERLRHRPAPRIAGAGRRSEPPPDLHGVRAEFERRLGPGPAERKCQRVESHGQRSGPVGTHGSGGGGEVPLSQ